MANVPMPTGAAARSEKMSAGTHQAAPLAHLAKGGDGSSRPTVAPGNECRYSRPSRRASQSIRPTRGSGWYEHGVYDVMVALSEVELNSYETEFRERTSFSATAPDPVQLPRDRPQPIVLRSKAKPKACAPPHPSTIRLNWQNAASQSDSQELKETIPPAETAAETEAEDAGEPTKAHAKEKKKQKSSKQEKSDKPEKAEKKKKHKEKDEHAPADS